MCHAFLLTGCWQDHNGSNCLGICLEGLSRTMATNHAILCTGWESAVHQTHTVQNRTAAVWHCNWTAPAGMWDRIVTCLQAALLTPMIQNCLLQNVQTSTGTQPHSYWMAMKGSFPRVKQSGHEVNQPIPSIPEAKNEWSCNSTPTAWTDTIPYFINKHVTYNKAA